MTADPMTLEELLQYPGSPEKAPDFDAYWEKALAELAGTDDRASLVPASFPLTNSECFDLWFEGVGGARVHAKYIRPKTPGPHPCVFHFHGYTWRSEEWTRYLTFLSEGICVAALDCRGQAGESEDVSRVTGFTYLGHITRGLHDSPEKLYYRQVFLDTVELVRVVSSFPEVDEDRLGAFGGSQGGGLSIACSALSGRIKRTCVAAPFLSDYPRAHKLGLFLSPPEAFYELGHYLRRFDPHHEHIGEMFERLSYIDVHHLAPRIKTPVKMAVTLQDSLVPPSTQFAIYNNLGGPKEFLPFYEYDHEDTPGWDDKVFQCMREL